MQYNTVLAFSIYIGRLQCSVTRQKAAVAVSARLRCRLCATSSNSATNESLVTIALSCPLALLSRVADPVLLPYSLSILINSSAGTHSTQSRRQPIWHFLSVLERSRTPGEGGVGHRVGAVHGEVGRYDDGQGKRLLGVEDCVRAQSSLTLLRLQGGCSGCSPPTRRHCRSRRELRQGDRCQLFLRMHLCLTSPLRTPRHPTTIPIPSHSHFASTRSLDLLCHSILHPSPHQPQPIPMSPPPSPAYAFQNHPRCR